MMNNVLKIALSRMRIDVQCMIALMMISLSGFSQNVAINTTLNPANASAGLDIDFANMGFLLPRVALTGTANAAPLSAHIAGMVVYNTATVADVYPAFYYDDGTMWKTLTEPGTLTGDMQYWDGTKWTSVSGGIAGQFLTMGAGGNPEWSGNISGYPTLSTQAASVIGTTTATSGGNITNDGGSAITARGVCWDTSPDPTISLPTKTSDGTGSGVFSSSLTGLSSGTTYYIRSYATNGVGTVYGNQLVFTTN
jgi:hypothetical protein